MIKRLMMVCAVLAFAAPVLANRGGGIRIEVKDFRSSTSRARLAEQVSSTLRDLGTPRLSVEVARVINEQASRLDTTAQTQFAKSLEAFLSGLRTHSNNRSSSIQVAKIESVSETLLNAALAIKSNNVQNAKTQELSDVLFSLLGPRLKEKLENENLEYDINKMQRVAEMVLTSNLSKRSITETEIDALYREIATFLGAKTLKEVSEC